MFYMPNQDHTIRNTGYAWFSSRKIQIQYNNRAMYHGDRCASAIRLNYEYAYHWFAH